MAQLQGEHIRTLPLLMEYLTDAGVIPAEVRAECISRLDVGQPAKGPSVEVTARRADKATGGNVAISLYKRFYRPASSPAVHAGAASLLRHVRGDGSLTPRPGRAWARRSRTQIADACPGILAAAAANRAGTPYQQALRYADKHSARALTPVALMSAGGFSRVLRPRQLITSIGRLRDLGKYARSGPDAADTAVRTARIRAGFEELLLGAEPDIPAGALDPFLDYVAAKVVSEPPAAAA